MPVLRAGDRAWWYIMSLWQADLFMVDQPITRNGVSTSLLK